MDGLTISTGQKLLETGQTSSEIKKGSLKNDVLGPVQGKSFSDTLNDAVESVNQLQKVSDQKMQELSTGKSKNIPEVMIAAEKADIALRLMVQVRNKIIDAYQEVMKMQM